MITFQNLSRHYGRIRAVDDISFTAQPGSVTGFLGPNGAGKSTALRCLVGLSLPTSGSATVLGHRYRELNNPGRQVGVMLDASAQHPGRTGLETLRLAARMIRVDDSRVDEALTACGLTRDEAGQRVGKYSLGMRQRLGIAQALLGEPEVLILDEPANGLDPQGIRWMRGLLRDFADDGGTVLLSSHLLHEVQQIADHVVMISRGRLLADDTLANLTAGGSDLEELFLAATSGTDRTGEAA